MDATLATWTPIDRRVVVIWRLIGVLVVAAVVAVLAGAELVLRNADALDGLPVGLVPGAVGVAGVVASVVGPSLAQRRWRYRLGELALELRWGVIVHRTSAIPYFRVQQVDLAQGPLERWLGLTRAVVSTAAATTDGAVPGLRTDAAEALRLQVLDRAGRDDAV